MRESEIQRDIMLAASKAGCRLWRNNVGVFRSFEGERVIRCGLAVGSADLIGITSDGRFLSVEVKRPKKDEKAHQERWRIMIRSLGGVAFVARSVDAFIREIEKHADRL